jgi:tellurite resistance protein
MVEAFELERLWSVFSDGDPVLLGVAAACALVAAADQKVLVRELIRFADLFEEAAALHPAEQPVAAEPNRYGRMATAFQDLAHALVVSEPAREQALAILRRFAGDRARQQTILRAAREALRADDSVGEEEWSALRLVREALGSK